MGHSCLRHLQKGAAPDPGPCKYCLQNDWKPDEMFGVREGTWNVGSMSGRGAGHRQHFFQRAVLRCKLFRGEVCTLLGVCQGLNLLLLYHHGTFEKALYQVLQGNIYPLVQGNLRPTRKCVPDYQLHLQVR